MWWWSTYLSIVWTSCFRETHLGRMCRFAGHSYKIFYSLFCCRYGAQYLCRCSKISVDVFLKLKVTGPMFTTFSNDVEASLLLLLRAFTRQSFCFKTSEQRMKGVNFDVYSLGFTLQFYFLLIIIWFYCHWFTRFTLYLFMTLNSL